MLSLRLLLLWYYYLGFLKAWHLEVYPRWPQNWSWGSGYSHLLTYGLKNVFLIIEINWCSYFKSNDLILNASENNFSEKEKVSFEWPTVIQFCKIFCMHLFKMGKFFVIWSPHCIKGSFVSLDLACVNCPYIFRIFNALGMLALLSAILVFWKTDV